MSDDSQFQHFCSSWPLCHNLLIFFASLAIFIFDPLHGFFSDLAVHLSMPQGSAAFLAGDISG